MKQATITVTDTTNASSRTIQLKVDPDPINLAGQGQGAVPIQWDIATRGWTFTANGIVIHNPGNIFPPGAPASGNTRYTWTRNPNQANGQTYKYSISVTDDTSTVIFDPGIINQA